MASLPPVAEPVRRSPSRRISAILGSLTLVVGTALGALVSAQPPVLAAQGSPPIVVVEDGASPPAAQAARTPATPSEPAVPAGTAAPTAVASATAVTPADEPAPAEPAPSDDPAGAPVGAPAPAAALPPSARHVWVVSLTGQDAQTTFAADSPARYLRGLRPLGTLLGGYVPLPGGVRTNSAALIAGVEAADHFGPEVPQLGGQLSAAGRSWKAYVEGQAEPCDPAFGPRDPFVLFDSVTGAADCVSHVVGLDALGTDLADPSLTPALSWVVPAAGHDGADTESTPAGLAGADAFLHDVVPRIVNSAAFADAGLLVIAFDTPAPAEDPAAPPAPTGVLLLSSLVAPGATASTPTGPYGLLRGLEDLLGLPHLGHAGDPATTGFEPATFTKTTHP